MSSLEPTNVAPVQLVPAQPILGNPVEESIRRGALYTRKKDHWTSLRREKGLPLPSDNCLTTDRRIMNEVEKTLQAAPATSIELPSAQQTVDLSQELEAIKTLAAKLPEAQQKTLTDFAEQVGSAKVTPDRRWGYNPGRLLFNPTQLSANELVAWKRQLLGQLIFLMDTNPQTAVALITPSIDKSELAIQSALEKSLKEITQKRQAKEQIEKKLGITDAAMYTKISGATELASLLVSSTGYFNSGILEYLLKQPKATLPYSEEVIRVLNAYKQNPSLLALLNKAEAPVSKDVASWDLILNVLDLSKDAPVTDTQAKRAHLATQLSEIQSNSTSLATIVRLHRLDNCACDLNSFLKNGSLNRMVDGHDEVITLSSQPNEEILSKKIGVDKDGVLTNGGGFLRDSHALTTATRAMGIAIDASDEALKTAAALIGTQKGSDKFETTPMELIEALVSRFPENERAEKINKAAAAFCSRSINPLFVAWQESFNQMRSLRPRLAAHGNVLRAVQAALYSQFKTEKIRDAKAIRVVFKNFLAELSKKVVIDYDPKARLLSLKGIATEEDFKQAIFTTAESATYSVLEKARLERTQDVLLQLLENVSNFVGTDKFLNVVITSFDSDNKKVEKNEDRRLPWQVKLQDNPFETLKTYLEGKSEPVKSLTAANAKELMQAIFAFVKETKVEAHERLTISSGQHAFTFTLDAKKAAEYVEKQIVLDQPLTFEVRKTIIDWVTENIVDSEAVDAFAAEAAKLAVTMSLPLFRRAILDLAMTFTTSSFDQEDKVGIERKFDSFIFARPEILSPEVQKELNPISFADTHWDDEGHNMQLCFYNDPIADTVKVGTIRDDGTHLMPMNQEKWIENKPWILSKTAVNPLA